MADDTPHTPRYVELLSAEKPSAQPPATQSGSRLPAATGNHWMPAPLKRRVLDRIARTDARVYGDRLAEENRMIALSSEQARLLKVWADEIGSAATLPMIAATAEIQTYIKLKGVIADAEHNEKLAQLRREEELAEAKRRRDAAVRGPLPALPAPPKEPARRPTRADRIKAIRKECEDTVALLREGRSDDELDADTRQIINDCRYHASRRIKAILEDD